MAQNSFCVFFFDPGLFFLFGGHHFPTLIAGAPFLGILALRMRMSFFFRNYRPGFIDIELE